MASDRVRAKSNLGGRLVFRSWRSDGLQALCQNLTQVQGRIVGFK